MAKITCPVEETDTAAQPPLLASTELGERIDPSTKAFPVSLASHNGGRGNGLMSMPCLEGGSLSLLAFLASSRMRAAMGPCAVGPPAVVACIEDAVGFARGPCGHA